MGDPLIASKKGQGATEYLVLLAVVLIVAMVAIALLGFFPGLAGDARITQSDTYWKGQAKPFAILEHSEMGGASNLSMTVQNFETDQRSLNNITLTGSGRNGTYTPKSLAEAYYSAGVKKIVIIPISAGNVTGNCTSGSVYEYYVTISYNISENTVVKNQIGTKTLVGKCS